MKKIIIGISLLCCGQAYSAEFLVNVCRGIVHKHCYGSIIDALQRIRSINARVGRTGFTLLQHAAQSDEPVFEALVALRGKEIDFTLNHQWMVLHNIIRNARLYCEPTDVLKRVSHLLKIGTPINALNDQGKTAAYYSLSEDSALLKILLSYGADPKMRGLDGENFLHKLISDAYYTAGTEEVLEKGQLLIKHQVGVNECMTARKIATANNYSAQYVTAITPLQLIRFYKDDWKKRKGFLVPFSIPLIALEKELERHGGVAFFGEFPLTKDGSKRRIAQEEHLAIISGIKRQLQSDVKANIE